MEKEKIRVPAQRESVMEMRPDVQERIGHFLDSLKQSAKEKINTEQPDNLYHNWPHSENVFQYSGEVLSVIREFAPGSVTPEMDIARGAASYTHDSVVDTMPSPANPDGEIMRLGGWDPDNNKGNEWKSYLFARENIEAFYQAEEKRCAGETCEEGYLEGLKHALATINAYTKEAIRGTTPNFGFGTIEEADWRSLPLMEADMADYKNFLNGVFPFGQPQVLKISQPYVTEDSDLVTLSVAIGDLSQVGRVPFETYLESGNNELRELKNGIDTRGQNLEAMQTRSEATGFAKDIIGWADTQTGFAIWQWIRFEELLNTNKALNALPEAEKIKSVLRQKFQHFKANADKAVERSRRLKEEYGGLFFPETDSQKSVEEYETLDKTDKDLLERLYNEEVLLTKSDT